MNRFQIFLTSELLECEWSVSCPGCFIPWKEHSPTIVTGGWDEASIGLDNVERRKILRLLRYELRPQIGIMTKQR
jgi:hypothetical protein